MLRAQQQMKHASNRSGHSVAKSSRPSVRLSLAVPCRSTVVESPASNSSLDMKAKAAFLKEDLSHLFDDQGIDASAYEKVVDFKDPITKYDSLEGFMFNIKMLRKVFNPTFELHEMQQMTPTSITTRWTMYMEFSAVKNLPKKIAKYVDPKLIFTGTSEYVYNPESGKINQHIDTWDSVSNQEYFSFEAFGDFFKQLLQPYTTPRGLDTPKYKVLRRTSGYQVRQYDPYVVAETLMDGVAAVNPASSGSAGSGTSPAGVGGKAFGQLAGYIFGKNQTGEKMAMTTPVYSKSEGSMQFVVGRPPQEMSSLPSPVTPAVATRVEEGGLYASITFNGMTTPEVAEQKERELRKALLQDGICKPKDGSTWTLARYNDPSCPKFFRRNEVLIPLESFNLWA
eukprot:gene4952-34731_t